MGRLTDERWDELLEREAAGEARGALAVEFGVSERAIRDRMARAGVAVDRRRRPPGGWPEDRVVGRAGMSRARWRELLERWHDGERDLDLAAEYGVSVGSIHRKARELGMRKSDRPEAVRRRSLWPRPSRDPEVRAACAFEMVPGDRAATLEALDAARARASEAGLVEALEGLSRADAAMSRAERERLRLAEVEERASRLKAGMTRS